MLRTVLIATISSTALLMGSAAMAQAQDSGTVLKGADAFGGYDQNAPGVTRKIMAADNPAPDEAHSSANPADPIAQPDGAMPTVPEGYQIEKVADGIEQPRAMTFAPNGDLFVANSAGNQVLVYHVKDDGTLSEKQVFASDGLNRPYGISFYPSGDDPQYVYVGNTDGLVRYPYASGDMTASGPAETLVSGIPSDYHWTRSTAVSPDDSMIYYAVGSGSNFSETSDETPPNDDWIADHPLGAMWGPEERRADVLTFAPDGSDEQIFATGLRNCSGLTVQPETGNLWCVVNERDALGDNVPSDYATHVQQGNFYGWPWYYLGDNEDPRLAGNRQDLAGDVTVPDVLFQAHSAPLNITFETGDGLGAALNGDAFVAMHGSWNRGQRTGYKIVSLDFKDGAATGEYTDFVTGFVTDDGYVWGRPVGVAVAPDGSLYFSEDANGSIWRVSKQ